MYLIRILNASYITTEKYDFYRFISKRKRDRRLIFLKLWIENGINQIVQVYKYQKNKGFISYYFTYNTGKITSFYGNLINYKFHGFIQRPTDYSIYYNGRCIL